MSSPYSTITDMESILGSQSIIQGTNDEDSATQAATAEVTNSINWADARIKGYVSLRYDVDVLTSAIDWLRWCSATFACVKMFRRRGNPLPPGLEDDYNEFTKLLIDIHDGKGEIPGATLKNEPGLVMSNLRFDPRFKYRKIRVEQGISAGEQKSEKPRSTDYVDMYPDF